MRAWVFGLEGFNVLLLVLMLFVLAQPVHAQEAPAAVTASQNRFLGAAIATGLAAIGSGIAVGIAGAAAIGAIAEKPELLPRAMLFVALGEGLAVLGFAFAIWLLLRM